MVVQADLRMVGQPYYLLSFHLCCTLNYKRELDAIATKDIEEKQHRSGNHSKHGWRVDGEKCRAHWNDDKEEGAGIKCQNISSPVSASLSLPIRTAAPPL
ncbi:unnamed protein product [Leuciscus chuanchicus]